jgi:ribose transport system permease protein
MTSTEAPVASTIADETHVAPVRHKPTFRSLVERYGLVVLFAVVFIAFATLWDYPATFRSSDNVRQVLRSQAIPAILALASILPLVCGQFDLTVGSVAGISAITVAGAITDHNLSLTFGVMLALGIGLVIGLVNGLLIAYVGVNSLIATLGVGIAVNGLVEWYAGGRSILIEASSGLGKVGSSHWFGVPSLVYFVAGFALVFYYLLQHTPLGRFLQSIGSNASAAHLVGLNVRRLTLLAFVISALVSSVAGVLYLGAIGSASASGGGIPLTMPALVAVFLGATTIKPGRFNVLGTLVAVYLLAFALSGLSLNGVEGWVQNLVTGTGLVLAVTLSTLAARERRST